MAEAPLQAACESRIGRTLKGKWTLEKLIGVGGMAAVYVGVHNIGRREAIKILHPEVARSKELVLRFEQEAKAVNRVSHPGTVEVRDSDTSEDGCPFLVMELLEGENLAERAGRLGGLPRADLLRYTDALLDVLAAAHAQGVIHRDIKLDNLFLTEAGQLKVLDFGIARITASAVTTRLGARLGTTAYMAPEQVRGHEVDARTDLFAVGATMFRIVAKRRVHDASSEAELLIKMGRDHAPPLASVAPGVDRDLALVVDRALAFDKADRYPDAATMQRDVRAVATGEPPPFASARAPAALVASVVAPSAPPGAAAIGAEPTHAAGVAFEPTRAEPSTSQVHAPPPVSVPRPAPQRTVAIATPPPGSLMLPTPSPAPPPVATPLPPSVRHSNPMMASSSTSWAHGPSSVPAASQPYPSVAQPSVAPLTPQTFVTPSVPPKKRGAAPIVLAVSLGICALVGGGSFLALQSGGEPATAAARDDHDEDEDDDEARSKKKKPKSTAEPSAAAVVPAAPASPVQPSATASAEAEAPKEEKQAAKEREAEAKAEGAAQRPATSPTAKGQPPPGLQPTATSQKTGPKLPRPSFQPK